MHVSSCSLEPWTGTCGSMDMATSDPFLFLPFADASILHSSRLGCVRTWLVRVVGLPRPPMLPVSIFLARPSLRFRVSHLLPCSRRSLWGRRRCHPRRKAREKDAMDAPIRAPRSNAMAWRSRASLQRTLEHPDRRRGIVTQTSEILHGERAKVAVSVGAHLRRTRRGGTVKRRFILCGRGRPSVPLSLGSRSFPLLRDRLDGDLLGLSPPGSDPPPPPSPRGAPPFASDPRRGSPAAWEGPGAKHVLDGDRSSRLGPLGLHLTKGCVSQTQGQPRATNAMATKRISKVGAEGRERGETRTWTCSQEGRKEAVGKHGERRRESTVGTQDGWSADRARKKKRTRGAWKDRSGKGRIDRAKGGLACHGTRRKGAPSLVRRLRLGFAGVRRGQRGLGGKEALTRCLAYHRRN